MKSKAILGEIINAKSNKEVALLYEKWVKTYDTDLEKVRPGNQGAIYTVEMFKKYVPLDGDGILCATFSLQKSLRMFYKINNRNI